MATIERSRPSLRTSLLAAVAVCFLLIADGTLVLYATLLWPNGGSDAHRDPLFIVGIVTFVVCFTLPFVLVFAFVVSELSLSLIICRT